MCVCVCVMLSLLLYLLIISNIRNSTAFMKNTYLTCFGMLVPSGRESV